MPDMTTQDAITVLRKAGAEFLRLVDAATTILTKEGDLKSLEQKIIKSKAEVDTLAKVIVEKRESARKEAEQQEANATRERERLATAKQAEVDRWQIDTEKVQKAHQAAKDDHAKTIAQQNAELADLGKKRLALQTELGDLDAKLKDVKKEAKGTADRAALLAR